MAKTAKTMLGGAAVLSVVGLVCKVVGALYRVPLSHIIGSEGMATYQLVFPTYNLLLTVSSAGLPNAIAQMVSAFVAKEDPRSGRRVFRISLAMLFALGCLGMLLMMILSPRLALYTKDPSTQPGFVAIAPALLLVCLLSAYRGFLQGQHNMVPTALSQLIEQVGKVVICLPLAYFGMRISVAYAAAGMLLGTSIAEAAALVYMMVVTRRGEREYASLPQAADNASPASGKLFGRLVATSVPMTLGACIVPIAGFIDSGMILGRLTAGAGLAMEAAKPIYGAYSGYVLTLINIPTAIATALSVSLVPSVSAAAASGDAASLEENSRTGLRLSVLVGLPCTVGMSLLARELLALLYKFETPELLGVTARCLTFSSLTILIFTVVQSTTGILQGLRKERIPTYTLVAGVAVKVLLNYVLIGTPGLGMLGAPLASIACYTISMVPNLLFALRYTKMRFDWKSIVFLPALSTAAMGLVLWGLKKLLPSSRLITILLVLAGVAVYAAVSLLTGSVTRADLAPLLRRFSGKRRGSAA